MDESSSSALSQLPQRRQPACDRCRSQKLRCIRQNKNLDETCLRCSQSRVLCFTSVRRPPGRPPGPKNLISPTNSPASHRNSRSVSATESLNQKPNTLGNITVVENPTISDQPGAGQNNDDYDFSTFDDQMETCFDFSADLTASASELLSSFGVANESADYFPFPDLSVQNSDSTIQSCFPRGIPHVDQQHNIRDADQTSDPGIILSILQQDISRTLIRLKSTSWDIKASLNLRFDCSQVTNTSRSQGHTGDILPNIFRLMSDLEDLLRANREHSASRQGVLSQSGVSRTYLDSSHILTAVSCYLQLLSIYDNISSYILDQTHKNPAIKDFLLHSQPRFVMAGVLIPAQTNMLGQLFVRLMESEIQPIESLLGVPRRFRISQGATDISEDMEYGLLSDGQGEALLETLQRVNLVNHLSGSGSVTSRSLKEKMERIRDLR